MAAVCARSIPLHSPAASAQTPGSVCGGGGPDGNQVAASVTVAQASTTLTLTTTSIGFEPPTSLPGNATNNPQDVNGMVATNDSNGFTVSVAADTADFADSEGTRVSIPLD